MIHEMLQNGLTSRIYQMRSELLVKFGRKEMAHADVYLVSCSTDVAALAEQLLKPCPTIIERTICAKGCEKTSVMGHIQVPSNLLQEGKVKDIFNSLDLHTSINCCVKDSMAAATTAVCHYGPLLVMEPNKIFSETETGYAVMKLQDLPLIIPHPTQETLNFVLFRVISYKGSTNIRENTNRFGHYTAMCRRTNSWIEYDDLSSVASPVSKSTKINVALIVYCHIIEEIQY